MTNANEWKTVADMLKEALPPIDEVLAQENYPLSKRHHKAFEIIQETMLTTSDYKAFLESDVHGKFLVIIQDWYRGRYGDAMDDDESYTIGMVMVHGTPFQIRVPHTFRMPSENNTQWIGFPASVQPEENPLEWIHNGPNLKILSDSEKHLLQKQAAKIANDLRSIRFDIGSLQCKVTHEVAELTASTLSNIESAAKYFCKRSPADLRHAGWEISQATEKAFKFYILQKGQTAKFTHDLHLLTDTAEKLGSLKFDKALVNLIPSGSDATNIRYHGEYNLETACSAYMACLVLIQQLAYDIRPESEYNVRNLRIQIKTPSWFEFDRELFRKSLADSKADEDE